MTQFTGLTAIYLNCSLKKGPRMSHTEGLMNVSKKIMEKEGVKTEMLRMADLEIAHGVQPDMTKEDGSKDVWPEIFKKVIAADILIIGTPIWLGAKSSMCSKIIERLYSESSKQNNKGQYIYYGKVGGCVITGNEDGVKHCARDIIFSLQHLGYSIPPQAETGWIGEAGPGPSYLDKEADAFDNEFTNRTTTFMTYNLMHLAKLLKANNYYPNYGNSIKEWNGGERWNFEKPKH